MSYTNIGYVVVKDNVSYLINRDLSQKRWWTHKLSEAMIFNSEIAAQKQADKYKYGRFEVKSVEEIRGIGVEEEENFESTGL